MQRDKKGQIVTVSRWSGLHFRQAREVHVRVFRVRREGAKDTKRDPRESWFVCLQQSPIRLPLAEVTSLYARRFFAGAWLRYLKQDLLWGRHMYAPQNNLNAGV